MLAIYGSSSKIAQELINITTDKVTSVPRHSPIVYADRHFFCRGLLRPKKLSEQTMYEVAETLMVNAMDVMRDCDAILDTQPQARICVVGSESGYAWSYDAAYAAAKAALHRYVETKRLKPLQQLVCIAPTIVEDAGMTVRREDSENLVHRCDAHPKQRWLKAEEVARMAYFLLYVDGGYTTGTVIRMHGGGGR